MWIQIQAQVSKHSLFHLEGSVLLAVFQMGIKLFTVISTRKIQMNSKIGSLLLCYGRSTLTVVSFQSKSLI